MTKAKTTSICNHCGDASSGGVLRGDSTHRDYAVGAPVQIRVYENRLKIWNPAVLPEGWTLAKLLGEHASSPFNPAIANAFFRAGEIEAWGGDDATRITQ